MQNTQIGFIGGGNMAASLIGGLAKPNQGQALISAKQIWVYDRDSEKMSALHQQFNIQTADSNEQLIRECDVIVLAIKPQVMQAVLEPLQKVTRQKSTPPLFVSIAAGIPLNAIQRWLNLDTALIRVMPNTPSLIGAGATGLYANQQTNATQKALCDRLFSTVGITQWVDSEAEIDDITALSGSGPAYVMLFIQSLVNAAVNAGMNEKAAKELALQTVSGATQLIKQSDKTIATLIDNVTSPGGTTEQALLSLKQAGLENIIADAFNAAKQRAATMSQELDI